MTAQVVSETSYKKGHGCLYTIFFGIFYWGWLATKWACKYFVALMYWICAAWVLMIIAAVKKKKFEHPQWHKKMMRRKGKAYTDEKTVFVCNECGHRQEG